MRQEIWRRIDGVLANALEMPLAEREEFLQAQLRDEAEALVEARRLLGQASAAERLFETSPVAAFSGLGAGSRLGPWELVRPLGSGGMGVVWLAQRVDGEASMHAAIKLLPPALVGPLREDGDLPRRFLLEKRILARLQHPGIARLLDASAGTGTAPNFVMEFVDGRPLLKALREREVSDAEKVRLFLKICDAVVYAHANLIIHRDLKPQNILVTQEGEPKLLDFGIAKILNEPAGQAALTLRRAFSLDYASPEQILGAEVNTLTDVYSLGLVLYEMLTGERARRWNDLAPAQVAEEARRFSIPLNGALQGDLLAITQKACAADPAQRYGSVRELADDLERWLTGCPVEARPVHWFHEVNYFVRRNRLAVGASLLALSVIVGLGLWGWVSARKAEEERQVAVDRSQQLARVLGTERDAREGEQRQRQLAEEQTAKANAMANLAQQRESEAEARMLDLLRVFESVMRATRSDVSKLAGGTSASARLLENLLEKLETLRASPRMKPFLMELKASAHSELAELYGGANSNLGDRTRSRQHRLAAISLWGDLVQLNPRNERYNIHSIENEFRSEQLDLPRIGQPGGEKWLHYEQRWLAVQRTAGNEFLLNRSIGNFYFWRARVHADEVASFEKALQSFRSNLPGNEKNPLVLRDLAIVHKYLASAHRATPQKLSHAREALGFDRLRVELDPVDATARIDLGFSLVAYADALTWNQELAQAMDYYRQGYELRKSLAQADPRNQFPRRSLMYPNREMGVIALRLKRWDDVAKAIEELAWQRQIGVTVEAADEGVFAYLQGMLSEARGGDACPHLVEASQWMEKSKAPPRMGTDTQWQQNFQRCSLTPPASQ